MAFTLAAVMAFIGIDQRGHNPLTSEAHLAEVQAIVDHLKPLVGADEPTIKVTSLGMRLALTADNGRYHLSVSHTEHDAAEAARLLGGAEFAQAKGVTHFRLDADESIVHHPDTSTATTSGGSINSGRPPVGLDDPQAYFERRPSD